VVARPCRRTSCRGVGRDQAWPALGVSRKSHIPNAVGYQEKHCFTPGDTGFKVWNTKFATLGLGICWDQWVPEDARSMALQGAQVLPYPTAIGTEPGHAEIDSAVHWQNVMCGYAGANIVLLVASNRIGTERATEQDGLKMTFYGSSFIADETGTKIQKADRAGEAVLVDTFDLDSIRSDREAFSVYRDRRPDLYGTIVTHGGRPTTL